MRHFFSDSPFMGYPSIILFFSNSFKRSVKDFHDSQFFNELVFFFQSCLNLSFCKLPLLLSLVHYSFKPAMIFHIFRLFAWSASYLLLSCMFSSHVASITLSTSFWLYCSKSMMDPMGSRRPLGPKTYGRVSSMGAPEATRKSSSISFT